MLTACLPLCGGQAAAVVTAPQESAAPEPLTVSIVTCYPGPEIYELDGHSAIRIQGPGVDSVWNFGMFDFAEPNFVYRFVKGDTDYMVGGYPFSWFMPEYRERGSRVVEQQINLTPEQARKLRERLQILSLPANCRYRYNYVRNNCATRITDLLDSVAGAPIHLHEMPTYGTYRTQMRHFHRNYPWYQFGIDLALGEGLDRQTTTREDMFTPIEMHDRLARAQWSDGRPVVSSESVLNEGKADATLPATPFYATPMAVGIAVLLISLIIAVLDIRRRRLTRLWYAILFGVTGLAGCLITFLVTVSSHEATSPNVLILWLNPVPLLVTAFIWSRKGRKVLLPVVVLLALADLVLLIVAPMHRQSLNAAVYPLLAASLVSAAAYTITSVKSSYNNVSGSRKIESGRVKTPRRSAPRTGSQRKRTTRR